MVGGGKDAFIGEVHRIALRLDGNYELVAGSVYSNFDNSKETGKNLGLEEDRIYKIRTAVGWELDEEGWFAPCPETGKALSLWDWLDLGLPLPEELDEE